MAKHLKLELEDEPVFRLIGLICPEPDYRTAFLINQYTQLYLERSPEDLSFVDKKSGARSAFPLFAYFDPNLDLEWFMVANKFSHKETGQADLFGVQASLSSYLVQDHKQADYFIQISEECPENIFGSIIKSIKAIPAVIAAYEVDPDRLKHKEYLYYLHENSE